MARRSLKKQEQLDLFELELLLLLLWLGGILKAPNKMAPKTPGWIRKKTPCLCKINGDEGKTQGPRVLSCLG